MKTLVRLLVMGLLVFTSQLYAQTPVPALIENVILMSGVTTNTTTVAKALPRGVKSLTGQALCSSGACTQTQAIFGDTDNDSLNGTLLCTITLSGTPRAQDTCPPISAVMNYYYVTTTNTTGTNATGAIYAGY